MGTLVSVTWFFSALRTSPPNYRRKMKIVILLFAVLATVNAAALQNAKAADESAAVRAADLPKPAKVEDVPKAAEVRTSLRLRRQRTWRRRTWRRARRTGDRTHFSIILLKLFLNLARSRNF